MRFYSLIVLFLLISVSSLAQSQGKEAMDGDLVFIVNPSGQGQAIQLATGSKFTHVGIIFIENGEPMVYHAVEPVSKNTLKEFAAMSADGSYKLKRLKDRSILTPEKLNTMLLEARSSVGKHYDLVFSWNDEELYCSEFVWKLYQHALKLTIGEPRPLKEFNLEHPVVKSKLKERYGNKIPWEEQMISPGDMFNSELLQ